MGAPREIKGTIYFFWYVLVITTKSDDTEKQSTGTRTEGVEHEVHRKIFGERRDNARYSCVVRNPRPNFVWHRNIWIKIAPT